MKGRQGFTLVEMLVVIGILGILASATVMSLTHMKRAAMQSEAQKMVTEVATAFNMLLQKERKWPQVIIDNSNQQGGMNEDVCAIFQSTKLLDVTTYKRGAIGSTINEDSLDRFGLMDPFGQAGLKKMPRCRSASTSVPSGYGTFADHLIQYRVDRNFDGYVDSSEGAPRGMRVRASVIVWSRGPDGKDDTDTSRYPFDDRLSWNIQGTK